MSGQLTRERLQALFGRLNEKLRAHDQRGELYIVGGALIALAHDNSRTTTDVDSHIREGRLAVKAAAAAIAEEEGLSRYWLNEAVTIRHLPESPDPRERNIYEGTNLKSKERRSNA